MENGWGKNENRGQGRRSEPQKLSPEVLSHGSLAEDHPLSCPRRGYLSSPRCPQTSQTHLIPPPSSCISAPHLCYYSPRNPSLTFQGQVQGPLGSQSHSAPVSLSQHRSHCSQADSFPKGFGVRDVGLNLALVLASVSWGKCLASLSPSFLFCTVGTISLT